MIVGSWNVNDVRNKLENENILKWLHAHEVVVLSEIKTSKLPHVAGFIPVMAKTANPRRGGVALLVKSFLYPDLCHIDTSVNDQIWFSFSSIPGTRFCGAYITPSSSPYYDESDIANLQAKSIHKNMNYVIVGDLNARVGAKAGDLISNHQSFMYNVPVDSILNENGKKLLNVCRDNELFITNNLKTSTRAHSGALTFRIRNKWTSQLDLCITSKELIPCISNFVVNQDISFPSNHAPISVSLNFPKEKLSLQQVLIRSADIGNYPVKQKTLCRPPISYNQIDPYLFVENMNAVDPTLAISGDQNAMAEGFSNLLYTTITNSKAPLSPPVSYDVAATRWERIMNCEDHGKLWKAIDWKGRFNPVPQNDEHQPSELEFQAHLEKLLNPDTETVNTDLSDYNVQIPVLDGKIEAEEVNEVLMSQVKENRGCGPDGNSPGVFKILPGQWIEFLCFLFNFVFVAGYPMVWASARLIMLFKKGLRNDCDNYRGISVINAISKIYDYVLNNRLLSWYKPSREQAGAQSERGCIEHIVTLRLLFNVFIRKKLKLFVVFVDFSKAYDMIPRSRLFDILIDLGCGVTMLGALISMYSNTTNFLGSTIITSTIGVRQGSPTSCYLFIIFVDVLILLLKSKCSPEPILGWLHCLMLMDDTIILATSREKMMAKLQLLDKYCAENGMRVNASKTKLMVINGTPLDKIPFVLSNFVVRACTEYVYLGAVFTADGRTDSSLKAHLESKSKELNKLLIFFATNYDAPFEVKKKVLEACFMSCILYGCEAWLNVPLKMVETVYMKAVKALLGVRITTPNDLCLVEGGFRPLSAIVKSRQHKFFKKMVAGRSEMTDDPFMHVFGVTRELNKPMWNYIESLLNINDFVTLEIAELKNSIENQPSCASKFHTYMTLNPTLITHNLYTKNAPTIPDYLRITFTRFRLSSHRLRVEIGRWSRTPRDQRICSCRTGVQDELHLFQCPLVKDILSTPRKTFSSPSDFFEETTLYDLEVLHNALNKLYDETEYLAE